MLGLHVPRAAVRGGRVPGVALLTAALLFAACTASDTPKDETDSTADSGAVDDTGDSGDSGETGDSGDSGETGDSGDSAACAITASAAARTSPTTWVDVSWEGDLDDAIVRFGEDTAYGRHVPGADGTALVRFLGAGVEWHFRVEGTRDGAPCVSDDLTVRVSPAPSALPALVLSKADVTGAFGPLVVTNIQGSGNAAVVVDRDGRYVWWQDNDGSVGVERTRVDRDGTGVWVLERHYDDPEHPWLAHESFDDGEIERIDLTDAHHDFTEIDAGGDKMAWLVHEGRNVDGMDVVGDKIVVLDDKGGTRELFNCFDWLPVVPNAGWEETTYPGAADWSHANSIEYIAAWDGFLVSLHFLPAVIFVDRTTGALGWLFGEPAGYLADFTFPEGEAPSQMHSPSLTAAGLMLFENGTADRRASRVVEYTVDWTTRSASILWTAAPSSSSYAYVLGDAMRLSNGTTTTVWGNLGVLEDFDADATPTWKVNLGLGSVFGFLDVVPPPWIPDAE